MQAGDTFTDAFKYEDTDKIKNMVEMRIDARSFHQSLLLRVLTTIRFPTGKHGSSAFIGPRLLNRYQLVLFSTTGVCCNVFKDSRTKQYTYTHVQATKLISKSPCFIKSHWSADTF
jgi:hypothetical protein